VRARRSRNEPTRSSPSASVEVKRIWIRLDSESCALSSSTVVLPSFQTTGRRGDRRRGGGFVA
jgi:hypothetical protein